VLSALQNTYYSFVITNIFLCYIVIQCYCDIEFSANSVNKVFDFLDDHTVMYVFLHLLFYLLR
jgi:hypothetical protein